MASPNESDMPKVVIIEFDKDIRAIFEVYLQDEGHTVFSFDSFDILPQLLKLKPDLILLDYFFRFKEANEFCSQLKKHPILKATPVILSSVDPNIEEVVNKLSANACLPKPFDLDSLKAEIDYLLN